MTVKQFLAIVEIRTKIVSISTFIISSVYIWKIYGELKPLLLLLVLVCALLLDMGTTAFNTYFDFKNGVDEGSLNQEKNKVLVHQGINRWKAFWSGFVLFLLAGLIGLFLAFLSGWPVLLMGLLSFGVGYFYSGGPYPISRTPVGELFAGGFLGSVFFLINVFIQQKGIETQDILFSLPMSLFIGAILTVNNTCDIQGDERAGRKTFSVRFGSTAGAFYGYVQMFGAYGLSVWLLYKTQSAPMGYIPLAIGILVSTPLWLKMKNTGFSHETKEPSMGKVSQLFLIFTLFYCVTLLFLNTETI